MDWSKGFSGSYYATIVDRLTWKDTNKFDITNGSVTRSDSSLIESANVSTRYVIENEQWIRVYMDTRQNGETDHVALFTGLAVPPRTDINGNITSYDLDCYSVLKPAEDVLLERGYYVPEGMNGDEIITKLLAVTPAPVVVDDYAPALSNTIIAEDNESNLSMVMKILQAINRRLRIDGDGTIHIAQKATEAVVTFSALDNDSIEPQITLTHDWFDCPNVFRAISDDLTAIARDERPDSFLSIPVRGREVWAEETGCNLSDSEGIAEYAERRLKEEQSRAYEVSYTRRYHPEITIGDLVGIAYPKQGLNGIYKVTAQSIEIGSGCRTGEQVEYW